jgi:hypothetical protein
MPYDIEKLLGYNSGSLYEDEAREKKPPKHPLSGKLLTRLEVSYLTRLLECQSFELVACAKKEIKPSSKLSKLFCMDGNTDKGQLYSINMTIALGENNSEQERVNHLISSIGDTLVHFTLYGVTDTGGREIIETVIRGNDKLMERRYSNDKGAFDDFSALIEIVQGIEKDAWSGSTLCQECPVRRVEVR